MKKIEVVSKARARFVRISPRKTRGVIDLIRGKKVDLALAILASINKKPKVAVDKLLRSAISNARQNPQILPEELFISKIVADKGPMLKRYRAAAMGRATMIRRRMTHLTVELARTTAEKVTTKRRISKTTKKKR